MVLAVMFWLHSTSIRSDARESQPTNGLHVKTKPVFKRLQVYLSPLSSLSSSQPLAFHAITIIIFPSVLMWKVCISCQSKVSSDRIFLVVGLAFCGKIYRKKKFEEKRNKSKKVPQKVKEKRNRVKANLKFNLVLRYQLTLKRVSWTAVHRSNRMSKKTTGQVNELQ